MLDLNQSPLLNYTVYSLVMNFSMVRNWHLCPLMLQLLIMASFMLRLTKYSALLPLRTMQHPPNEVKDDTQEAVTG